MIVGGFSFCVPALQFRPADSALPAPIHSPSPLFRHFSSLFCTRAKAISFLFNPLRTSVTKHWGCHQERSLSSSTVSLTPSVSPLESTLIDERRVSSGFGRSRPFASPLDSALA